MYNATTKILSTLSWLYLALAADWNWIDEVAPTKHVDDVELCYQKWNGNGKKPIRMNKKEWKQKKRKIIINKTS